MGERENCARSGGEQGDMATKWKGKSTSWAHHTVIIGDDRQNYLRPLADFDRWFAGLSASRAEHGRQVEPWGGVRRARAWERGQASAGGAVPPGSQRGTWRYAAMMTIEAVAGRLQVRGKRARGETTDTPRTLNRAYRRGTIRP